MNYKWKDVLPVNYWVQNILPQSYTDSLSFQELLAKVIAMLNKVIENNNMIPQYVQDMILAYISSGEIGNVVRDILANYMLNVKNPPNNLTPAIGDGSADDTEAIQGCLDYANANGGKCIYFPSGSYLTQSLDWKNNVSVCGFDRSTTRIVLKGGAVKPLISGTVNNVTISKLKLDGNMDIQVNNIDLIDLTGSDIILTDLDFTDGYNLVKINATGNISGSLLVFDTAVVDAFVISGAGIVNFDNIMFKKLSALNGRYIINNSVDNAVFTQIYSVATTDVAINNTGNKAVFEGQILNTTSNIITDIGISTFTNFYSNGGTVQKSVLDEKTAREIADTALQLAIDEEEAYRINAVIDLQNTDTALQLAVDSVEADVAENSLQISGIAINVKTMLCDDGQYVKGDGVHDDTTGINKALALGKKIYFPKGVYVCEIAITTHTLSGHSADDTYLVARSQNGYALSIHQNGVWFGTVVENLSFSGGLSIGRNGGCVRFGHEPYVVGDEYAGGVKFKNCNFTDSDICILKQYGNIGNSYEHCRFTSSNYHYLVNKLTTSDPMHSGDDTFYKCHFDASAKCSYYFAETSLSDKIVFNDCIFETNSGFNIFAKLDTANEVDQQQGFELINTHMENSATAGSVTLYDGNVYTPVYVELHNIRKFLASNTVLENIKLFNSTIIAENAPSISYVSLDGNSLYYPTNPANAMYQDNKYVPLITGSRRTVSDPATMITKPRKTVSSNDNSYVFSETFDNRPKTFSGGIVSLTTKKVRDGILFGGCAELTVPANNGTSLMDMGSRPANKWVVISLDIKKIGGNSASEIHVKGGASYLMKNIQNVLANYSNTWVSLLAILPPSVSADTLHLSFMASNVESVYHLSALQVQQFDLLSEAVRYVDSGIFSISADDNFGRPVVTYDASTPVTGYWRKGDMILNTNPSTNTTGWVCTLSGSPGTWIPIVSIPVVPAQADSVASDVTTVVADFNSLLGKLRTAGYLAV